MSFAYSYPKKRFKAHKKIATVVGARPQFVKMGPVSRLFHKNKIREIVIHTGQHYDYNLSDIFFKELGLSRPAYNLGIVSAAKKKSNKTVSFSDISQISLMLVALEKVLIKEKPQLVLTYGDTNSSLACALAASKLNLSLAHVEAGVRGFDRNVPEEINRLIIDRVSELLFCPTENAVQNLKNEGMTKGVFYTGDVMADVLKANLKKISSKTDNSGKGGYILVTLHRQENVDRKETLEEICKAFRAFKGRLVFPIHPRTGKNLKKFGLWGKLNACGSVEILKPQSYLSFLNLQKNADKILTDSGGVQREAYLLRVPCLTLRTATEWPETLENGWSRLVDCRKESILRALNGSHCLGRYTNIFGNEKSGERIFKIINTWLRKK